MFGRRNKPDGFEWHKYIRTTIRLRREQRRERVLEARRAAGQQASAAGVALAQGSRAAGAAALGRSACRARRRGVGWRKPWWRLSSAARSCRRCRAETGDPGAAADRRIGAPQHRRTDCAGRGHRAGLGHRPLPAAPASTARRLITLGIGIVLLIAALPLLSSLTGIRMPRLSPRSASRRASRASRRRLRSSPAALPGSRAAAKTNLAGLAGQLPLVGGAKPLQGRAEALGGDLVRVAGTTVRLAGIEAPERQQTCGAGGRRYQCGAAAQAALGRLVNGRALSCTLVRHRPRRPPARHAARAASTDINGELVRQGHVFAAQRPVCQLCRPGARGARRQGRHLGRRRGRASLASSAPRCGRKPSAAPPTAARSRGW